MINNDCDLAVIGAGITGLSAAIGAHFRNPKLKIKVFGLPFDSNTAKKGELRNFPGWDEIIGLDLIQRVVDHTDKFHMEYMADLTHETAKEEDQKLNKEMKIIEKVDSQVTAISKTNEGFNISTDDSNVKARAIVLALGCPDLKYSIKGEKELEHKGVSHCAVCDGTLFRGKKVCIIGDGNIAARGALFLHKYCRKITILCPNSQFNCDSKHKFKLLKSDKVKVILNVKNIEILGSQIVESVKFQVENEEQVISVNGVFVELKDKPDLIVLKNMNIEINDQNFIIVDQKNSTNLEGVFAAGTVRGEMEYAPVVMGDGYKAGVNAANFLT